ncbi:MAG: radical SAM protein [Pirellulaceae bacterium]|nr:radical SAM protein [Pirellulaceae bacterium]
MQDLRDYYHVTVLSNFVRGFDKYARSYSKKGIPESTNPGRFFLLTEQQLEIGVKKASDLLEKLAIPGNRLIVLGTKVSPDCLRRSESGLGQFVQSDHIRLSGLSDLRNDGHSWQLQPLMIEEAVAQSLRLLKPDLIPFRQLLPRTFSILPIAKGCQASCPFCFSEASVSAVQEQSRLDLNRARQFAVLAHNRGAERFVITGGGEPGLVPHHRLLELIAMGSRVLGKCVLITNGHHLARLNPSEQAQVLADYHAAGLSVLAVSRHHDDEERNAKLMSLTTPIATLAATWFAGVTAWPSLRFRLTCVLQQGGIASVADVNRYATWAAGLGIREVCFKELYVSTSIESVYHALAANEWSHAHQVPLSIVLEFAEQNGFQEISHLPWGAPVFRGELAGQAMQIAAYTEPSLFWEQTCGIARSWNLMADGSCLVSLEDRASEIELEEVA